MGGKSGHRISAYLYFRLNLLTVLNIINFCFSRALLLLRKKKFQEQVLSKTDGQLENLERMVHDIEFAQVELKVVDGLKVGNAALKKLHSLLSIDEIEKVMDETKEGLEKQREIDEILLGELTVEDEGEVEEELDALLAAEVKERAPEVPVVPEDVTISEESEGVTLPEVPDELPQKKKGEAIHIP